jgi:glycogen operon protein
MLLHGDEVGRTQYGNNNAYCQDNETTWLDWDLSEEQRDLLDFVRRIIKLRQEHPVFRRRRFFLGRTLEGVGVKDVIWLTPAGEEMSVEEWESGYARSLGLRISGAAGEELSAYGTPEPDDDFLLLFNAHYEEVPFVLPPLSEESRWESLVDTSLSGGEVGGENIKPGVEYPLQARSLVVLSSPGVPEAQ